MRLVLVRLSALGDLVHTWPLANALRRARPKLHISWVVEHSLRSLVDGHPAVDCTLTVHTRRWRRAPFSAQTRAETAIFRSRLLELEADLALDIQGTLKSAWVTHASGAKERVGLARPWRRERLAGLVYDRTVQGSVDPPHVVATNLAAARAVGVEPGELMAPDGRWLLERGTNRPSNGSAWPPRYSVVLPGAGHSSKIVPESVLAEVAKGLADRSVPAVVAWGPGEEARARTVVQGAAGKAILAPPTTILELAHLCAGASLVVGGDTGPIHLAASLGVATLAVFVATDWRRNGPLGDRAASISAAKLAETVRPNRAKALAPGAPTPREILRRCDELLKS